MGCEWNSVTSWGECTKPVALVCVVVASVLCCAVARCVCRCREKQRAPLGYKHPYFESINDEDNRNSLMNRYLRESQAQSKAPLLADPQGSVSPPRAVQPAPSPGLLTTSSKIINELLISPLQGRTRSNTGASLGLIDNGNYHEVSREEDPIGCGAAGDVVAGTWRGRQIAIKLLQAVDKSLNLKEAQDLLLQFQREVVILCDVEHENLVKFYGYTTKPNLCVYMELVKGGSLDHALYRRKWRPTHTQTESMVLDIAKGMAYLHSRKVIHRDLKSPNLLLTSAPDPSSLTQQQLASLPCPMVKITDFGLSREKPEDGANNLRMTNVAAVAGTPSWMAPELFDPVIEQRRTRASFMTITRNYTEAVDTYAFAVVVSELLTCKLPWAGHLLSELRQAVLIDRSR